MSQVENWLNIVVLYDVARVYADFYYVWARTFLKHLEYSHTRYLSEQRLR